MANALLSVTGASDEIASTASRYGFRVTDADFAGLSNTDTLTRQILRDGAVAEETVTQVTTPDGAIFLLLQDGIVLFDAAEAAAGMEAGETRTATLRWTETDGTARSVAVTFGGGQVTSGAISALNTDGAAGQLVQGTFEQTEAVDVIGALFEAFDDAVPVDLDSLLDLQLVDIDTTFHVSFDAQSGLTLAATDNQSGDAIVTDLGASMSGILDTVNGVTDIAWSAIPLPVTFGPTFDLTFGVKANLGWDINLPTLGKTSFNQPVSITLYLPEDPIETGVEFAVGSGGLVSHTPTAVAKTLGLGSINVNLGFAVADFKLSGLGLSIGTKDLLGLPLEGLAQAAVELNAEFDIDALLQDWLDVVGPSAPGQESALPTVDVNFGFDTILRGLMSIETNPVEVIKGAIDAIKSKDVVKIIFALKELRDMLDEAIELVSDGGAEFVRVFGTEMDVLDLVALSERASFGEYDYRDLDGVGWFTIDGARGPVSGAQVHAAVEQTGAEGILDSLLRLFGEEGFSPMEGLTLKLALPFGNAQSYDGYGDGETGDRDGTQVITVEQATTLAGVSVNFETLAPELAGLAVDIMSKAGLQAAKSQPYLIPIVAGAVLGAKTVLNVQEEYNAFIEDGLRLDTQLDTSGLIAGVLNPVLETMNQINGVVASLTDTDAHVLPLLSETAPQADIEAALFDMRDEMNAGLRSVFDMFDVVADELNSLRHLTALAFDSIEPLITSLSHDVSEIYGYLSDGLSTIESYLSAIEKIIGDLLGGVDLGVADAVRQIRDIIGSMDALNEGMRNGVNGAQESINQFLDEVQDLPDRISDALTGAVSHMTGVLIDFSRGFNLSVDVNFDFFDFLLDAGVEVVQIATFDPDDVTVSYTIDGVTRSLSADQQVEFLATGEVGSLLQGEAVYSFSGDVDYDYRLRLNLDPHLSLYNTDVSAQLTAGGQEMAPIDFDYSLIETTRDVTLDTLEGLIGGQAENLMQLFDDALVEIPLELFDQVAQVAMNGIRDQLGVLGEYNEDLPWNELRLFKLDGVEIGPDQFTEIRQAFEIAVAGVAQGGNPLSGEWVWEKTPGFYTFGSEFDAPVVSINGALANVGAVLDVDYGQLVVTPEGQISFAPGEGYTFLMQDQWREVSFTYALATGVEGTATLRVRGENDAQVMESDVAGVTAGGATVLRPLGNDTDADLGDSLRITHVTSDAGATVSFTDGEIAYQAPDGFLGTDTVTYYTEDSQNTERFSTIAVSVFAEVAVSFGADVAEDAGQVTLDTPLTQYQAPGTEVQSINGDMTLIGDWMALGDGLLRVGADGTVQFDTNGAFAHLRDGEEQVLGFEFSTDGIRQSEATILVVGANSAPVAGPDTAHTGAETAVLVDVLANDSDLDAGSSLSLVGVDASDHGTVAIQDGQVLFTPHAGVHGRVELSYTVQDNDGLQTQGAVQVFVDPEDRHDVWLDAGVGPISLGSDLLFSDDLPGVTVTSVNGSPDAIGVWVPNFFGGFYKVDADGHIHVDPAGDFDWLADGEDLRTDLYLSFDQTEDSLVIYGIRGQDAAAAPMDDHAQTPVNTALTVDVLTNDRDASLVSVSGDALASAEIVGGQVQVTPETDAEGLARITYTVSGPDGGQTEATLHVEVGAPEIARLGRAGGDGVSRLPNVVPNLGTTGLVTAVNGQAPGTITLDNGVVVTLSADGSLWVDPTAVAMALPQGEVLRSYLEITVGPDSFLASVDVVGANDAPETRNEREGVFVGDTARMDVLRNDSDPDLGDSLTLVEVGSHPGGTVSIDGDEVVFVSDGQFVGDADIRYVVEDSHGARSEAVVRFSVFPNDDGGDGGTTGPTQDNVVRSISGTFRQLGGMDVGEALIGRFFDATGFDINQLLDFTLIDIDAIYELDLDTVDGLTFSADHNYDPKGVLAGAFLAAEDAMGEVADFIGDGLNIDLGALELSAEINAKLGFDLHLGWDIDLVTLGKTAFNQPVTMDLVGASQVVAGEAFTIGTENLRSLSPTTVTETIGMGRTQVFAGLDFFGTEVGEFGFGVKSSDFGPFKLDGVFDASLRSNYALSLEALEAFVQQFIKDAAKVLSDAAGIPIDAGAIIDLAFALDPVTMVQAMFSSETDWEAFYDLLGEKDSAALAQGIIDFLMSLSEIGAKDPETHDVAGVTLSYMDIYQLYQRSLFGEFDGTDDDGTPGFWVDTDDDPAFVPVVDVQVAHELLDLDSNVLAFVEAIENLGVQIVDSAEITIDLPVGNTEAIAGFEDAGDARDTDARDGVQTITVSQTTRVLDIDIDFEALQADMLRTTLTKIFPGPPPPGVDLMIYSIAASQEMQRVVEEGITGRASIQPKALVLATVNGLIDVINGPIKALNAVLPDSGLSEITPLTPDAFDAGFAEVLDQSLGLLRDAFDQMFGAFDFLKELITPVSTGGAADIVENVGGWVEYFLDTVEAIDLSPFDRLADEFTDFRIWFFGYHYPLRGIGETMSEWLGHIRDVFHGGASTGYKGGVRGFINSAVEVAEQADDFIRAIAAFDPMTVVDEALAGLRTGLEAAAEAVSIEISTGFEMMEAGVQAGVDLIQTASFDPDAVEAIYRYDGQEQRAGLGETVTLQTSGTAGQDTTGEVEYRFSGDVDYDYRLAIDISPVLNFYETQLSAQLQVGDEVLDFSHAYSLLKIGETSPLNGDGFASQFDEALIELNFDFVQAVVAGVRDQVSDLLGLELPPDIQLEDNEVLLFLLEDVPLDQDRFESITEAFSIQLVDEIGADPGNVAPQATDLTLAYDATGGRFNTFADLDISDADGDALTLRVVQGQDLGEFLFAGDVLSFAPRIGLTGTHEVALAVSDGLTETQFTLTLQENELAELQGSGVLDLGLDRDTSGQLTASDAEGATVRFALRSGLDPNFGSFTLQADGQYTVTLTEAAHGTRDVTIALDDGIASREVVVQIAGTSTIGQVLFGTDGDDTLTGTAEGDTIEGGAGDDSHAGQDGDDIMVDGAGSDTYRGGDGLDQLWLDATMSDMGDALSLDRRDGLNVMVITRGNDTDVVYADVEEIVLRDGVLVPEIDDPDTADWQFRYELRAPDGTIHSGGEVLDTGRTSVDSYENGVLFRKTFRDFAGIETWSYAVDEFDPAGVKTFAYVLWNDGTDITINYANGERTDARELDLPDLFDWHQIDRLYNAQGQEISVVTLYDDGLRSTDTFVDGVLAQRLDEDDTGTYPNISRLRIYAEDGTTVTEERNTRQDGVDEILTLDANGEVTRWEEVDSADTYGWHLFDTTYVDGLTTDQTRIDDDGFHTQYTFNALGQTTSRIETDLPDHYDFALRTTQFDPATLRALTQDIEYDDGRTERLEFNDDGIEVSFIYDASGQLTRRVERDLDDVTSDFDTRQRFYNADDQVFREIVTADDGSRTTYRYENTHLRETQVEDLPDDQPWTTHTTFYNGSGQVSRLVIQQDDGLLVREDWDNGTRLARLELDEQGAYDFVTQTITYADTGDILQVRQVLDDGVDVVTDYVDGVRTQERRDDTTDQYDWDFKDLTFTGGVLTTEITKLDISLRETRSYDGGTLVSLYREDLGTNEAWTDFLTEYDAQGQITRIFANDDDGLEVTFVFENNAPASRLERDLDDAWEFVERYREFDPDSGTLLHEEVQQDNGLRVVYDRLAEGIDVVETFDAADQRLSRLETDIDGVRDFQTEQTTYDGDGAVTSVATLLDDGVTQDDTYAAGLLADRDRQDVEGAHDWTRIVTTHAPDGSVTQRVTTHDTGVIETETFEDGVLRKVVATDPEDAEDFVTRVLIYDADGNLTEQSGTRDDGVDEVRTITDGVMRYWDEVDAGDTYGWHLFKTEFDAAGIVTWQWRQDDNGYERTQTFVDGVLSREVLLDGANAADWADWEQDFDENGVLTLSVQIKDDGARDTLTFEGGVPQHRLTEDLQDTRPYAEKLEHLLSDWTVPFTRTVWDDGTATEVDSPADGPLVTREYDADGVIQSETTLLDTGEEVVKLYEAGVLVSETRTDHNDLETWQTYARHFDADGAVTHEIVLQDYGVTVRTDFENGKAVSRTEQDGDGSSGDFQQRMVEFAEDGSIAREELVRDDGIETTNLFENGFLKQATWEDASDIHAWETVETQFTDFGEVLTNRREFDDGRFEELNFLYVDEVLVEKLHDRVDGNQATTTYNEDGQRVSMVLEDLEDRIPWAKTITNYFDDSGLRIGRSVTRDDGTTSDVAFTYDEDGRLTKWAETRDSGSTVTMLFNDSGVRLTRTFDDVADELDWAASYTDRFDDAGQRTGRAITRDDGTTLDLAFTYDDDGNVIKRVETRDDGSTLTTVFSASGARLSRTFDDLAETLPWAASYTDTYNDAGQRISRDITRDDGATSQITFAYDEGGALTQKVETLDNGNTVTTKFAASGARVTRTFDDLADELVWAARYTDTYNEAGQRISRSLELDDDGGTRSVAYGYDDGGALVERALTLVDGTVITTEFDSDGTRLRKTLVDTPDALTWAASYTDHYNAAGQHVHRDLIEDDGDTRSIDFVYDDDGLLQSRVDTRGNGDIWTTNYDTDGLRTTQVVQDISDTRDWTTKTCVFDDAGAVVDEIYVWDTLV